MPLMIATAATVFLSPPKFSVAGIARASVKLRLANARLLDAEMPMAKHTLGYAYRDPIESTRLGNTMAVKCCVNSRRYWNMGSARLAILASSVVDSMSPAPGRADEEAVPACSHI